MEMPFDPSATRHSIEENEGQFFCPFFLSPYLLLVFTFIWFVVHRVLGPILPLLFLPTASRAVHREKWRRWRQLQLMVSGRDPQTSCYGTTKATQKYEGEPQPLASGHVQQQKVERDESNQEQQEQETVSSKQLQQQEQQGPETDKHHQESAQVSQEKKRPNDGDEGDICRQQQVQGTPEEKQEEDQEHKYSEERRNSQPSKQSRDPLSHGDYHLKEPEGNAVTTKIAQKKRVKRFLFKALHISTGDALYVYRGGVWWCFSVTIIAGDENTICENGNTEKTYDQQWTILSRHDAAQESATLGEEEDWEGRTDGVRRRCVLLPESGGAPAAAGRGGVVELKNRATDVKGSPINTIASLRQEALNERESMRMSSVEAGRDCYGAETAASSAIGKANDNDDHEDKKEEKKEDGANGAAGARGEEVCNMADEEEQEEEKGGLAATAGYMVASAAEEGATAVAGESAEETAKATAVAVARDEEEEEQEEEKEIKEKPAEIASRRDSVNSVQEEYQLLEKYIVLSKANVVGMLHALYLAPAALYYSIYHVILPAAELVLAESEVAARAKGSSHGHGGVMHAETLVAYDSPWQVWPPTYHRLRELLHVYFLHWDKAPSFWDGSKDCLVILSAYVMTSYFVWDTVECLQNFKVHGRAFFFHALLSLLAGILQVSARGIRLAGICSMFATSEISTPFLHFRWFLIQNGQGNTRLCTLTTLWTVFLFILVRTIMVPCLVFSHYWGDLAFFHNYTLHGEARISALRALFMLALTAAWTALNLFWCFLFFRTLFKKRSRSNCASRGLMQGILAGRTVSPKATVPPSTTSLRPKSM